jgi:hypothetical protein
MVAITVLSVDLFGAMCQAFYALSAGIWVLIGSLIFMAIGAVL